VRRALLLSPLILLLTVFGSPGTAGAATSLTAAEITQGVNAHNQVRQQVAQSESARLGRTITIPNLAWDATVAATAQDWANQQAAKMQAGQASPAHRPNNAYGENLQWSWSTPTPPNPAPSVPVTSWANERPFYNYDTNTCAAGKDCKHFTQIVWKATTKLGCGRATWSTGTKHFVLWVCNYSPKGNITGQRPY